MSDIQSPPTHGADIDESGREQDAGAGESASPRRFAPSDVRSQALMLFVCFVIPLGLILAVGPIALGRGGWYAGFRNYFPSDQLSYAAIASNVAHSGQAFVEPFTRTGSSYYPSLYYVVIGVFARVTGASISTSWNLLAVAFMVILLVVGASWAFLTTKKWWSPVLALAPLSIGTVTWIRNNNWGCRCGAPSHAVIWPVNAALYTGNGEVAGLVVGVAGVVIFLRDIWRRDGHLPGTWATILGFGLIGLTANIHTYAFFASVTVGLLLLWAVLLQEYGSREVRIATFVLLAVAIPVGQGLSEVGSPLLATGAFILPLAPGLVVAWRRRLAPVAVAFLAAGVCAAPQLIHTAAGLASSDSFLLYREASGAALTVGPLPVLVAQLPIVLMIGVVLVCGWPRRSGARMSLPRLITLALALSVVIMGWNNVWGFGQEPYRFVIQQLFFVLVIVPPLVVVAVRERFARPTTRPSLYDWAVSGLSALMVLTVTVSFAGTALLWDLVRAQGTIEWSPGMQAAARRTSRAAGDNLVLVDSCVQPALWKLYTDGRVAFYNAGIAWPTHRLAIDAAVQGLALGQVNVAALQRAHTKYVLSSTTCANATAAAAQQANLQRVFRTRWLDAAGSEQSFVLWRVPG